MMSTLQNSLEDVQKECQTLQQRVDELEQQNFRLRETLLGGLHATFYRMFLPEGVYEYLSPNAFNTFGYSAETFLSNPLLISEVLHSDFVAYFGEKWSRLNDGIVDPTYEYKIFDAEGRERWILQANTGIFDSTGAIVAIEGICMDVTQYKNADSTLRKNQRLLSTVLDAIPAVIFAKDDKGRLVLTNQLFNQFFNAQPGEMLGKTDYDLFPKEFADSVQMVDQQVKETTTIVRTESEVPSGDGDVRTYLDLKFPILDDTGNIFGIGGFAMDISERKRMEQALQESEERLKFILEGSNDGAWDWNVMTGEAYLSPHYKKLLGYEPDELPDSYDSWLDSIHPEDKAYVLQQFDGYLYGNLPSFEVEHRLWHKSGVWIWFLSRGKVVVHDKSGNPVRVTGTIQDISERKRAEDALNKARETAEAANRAKSTFLANMSHELRTPLNAILGFAQIMQRQGNLTPDFQEYVNIIYRNGEHLLTLINSVLDLSKIEAGRIIMHTTAFDVHQLLHDLKDMFAFRAKEKNLIFFLEAQPEIPQYVQTDEIKLRQILINLLSNALKFTEEGGVVLRVKCQARAEDVVVANQTMCWSLHFEVEDTGPGILPEELDHLFQAFVQTKAGKKIQEGTGLGLAISHRFVQIMGGNLTVQSHQDRGSIFSFAIPIAVVDSQDMIAQRKARRVIDIAPGQAGYRILIVDDRPDSRTLLFQLLKPLGFALQEAGNGKEAVAIWQDWNPHLIWMDMRMPLMDGYEATRTIKSLDKNHNTVVIALTASSFEEDRVAVMEAGCDDFVRKPFREFEIFDALTRHLGVRFIYEDVDDDKSSSSKGAGGMSTSDNQEDVSSAAALSKLDPALLVQLEQAVIETNPQEIERVIDQIRLLLPKEAEVLNEMVYDFDYAGLRAIIRAAREAGSLSL